MKKLIFLLFFTLIFLLSSCPDDGDYYENYYSNYAPILMTRENLEKSIQFQKSQPLKNTGKIYFSDSLIFINEKYYGIHIINNSNPANPASIAFIAIPGCIDMAVKNNVLYADNAVDLAAIEFNIQDLTLKVNRTRNIFPEIASPDGKNIEFEFQKENRPPNTIIVGWVKKR